MRSLLLSAALFVSAVTPVLSAENDWSDCTGDDPARAVAACSRVIRSAGSKAISASAYYNRGIARNSGWMLCCCDRAGAPQAFHLDLKTGDMKQLTQSNFVTLNC